MRNRTKITKNSQFFQIFQSCNTLWSVSEQSEATWRRLWAVQSRLGDVLGGLRAVLEASWSVLGASWRCLGGILGRLGGILDVSWGKCRKKVEGRLFFGRVLRAKMEQKSLKFALKLQLAFLSVF